MFLKNSILNNNKNLVLYIYVNSFFVLSFCLLSERYYYFSNKNFQVSPL